MAPLERAIELTPILAELGRELQIQYFADVYPVKVEAVGCQLLYDPEKIRPQS